MIIPHYSSIMRTKYWLSILAVSVVLLTGSLAVNPIAIADDDDNDDDDDDDGPGDEFTTYSRSSPKTPIVAGDELDPISVFCDDGDIATGGGVHSEEKDIHTVSSAPTGGNPPTGWVGSANNAAFGPGTITVYVVCIDK